MKQKLANFLQGRYGTDQFTKALMVLWMVIFVISLFSRDGFRDILAVCSLALAFYIVFRTLSRKIQARAYENQMFLAKTQKIRDYMRLRRDMWQQRKDYKFFKCPSCKAVMRVPKGKGNIRIVCRKCGNAFEKRT